MLRSERRFGVVGSDLDVRQTEWRSEGLIVVWQRAVGARVDRRFRPRPGEGWTCNDFVDLGDGTVRWSAEPGELSGRGALLPPEASLARIVVRGAPIEDAARRLEPVARAAMNEASSTEIERWLTRAGRSPRPVRPDAQRFSAALAEELAHFERGPSLKGLAARLRLPVARVSELGADYFDQYHASVHNWRGYLTTLRLELASTYRRAERPISTTAISRSLGFSGPTALCHALQRGEGEAIGAGAPRPSRGATRG